MAKAEKVVMAHTSGRRMEASQDAFDRIYSHDGWTIVDDKPSPPAKKKAAAK